MTIANTKKMLVAAFAFLIGTSLALGQKQEPPAGGPPKPFNVPAHENYTLPNGMAVTLIPYGRIPKVGMSLSLRAGKLNEPKAQRGIARITANLLKEGTTSLNSKALAETAASMGTTIDVAVSEDETSVAMDVLSESGPDAVSLLADVAQHPLLPESELARLKSNMLREIAVQKSQPGYIAAARFYKLLYGDHPYGDIMPAEDSVNGFTINDVKSFYGSNFGAARAHLYIAGKFDTAAMKKAVSDHFSGWAQGPAPALNVPTPKTQRILDVTDRPAASQSNLIVGLPVPNATSPDYVKLRVTNALLGGSFISRITANIREQKGYTYSPHSEISQRYHDSFWAEFADVTTAVTGPALKEIFGEIDRLAKEAPGQPELQGIQAFLSGSFVIQNADRGTLIRQMHFVDFQGLSEDYLKNYIQNVNAVTPKDVQQMTAQYLKPDQMTIVVVGDKSKISSQLAPFSK
jgi:predicted Zn-dependent peptidase